LDFKDLEWMPIHPDVMQVIAKLTTEGDLDLSQHFEKEVKFSTPSSKVEDPEISELVLWLN
jgi:hypothetical protein